MRLVASSHRRARSTRRRQRSSPLAVVMALSWLSTQHRTCDAGGSLAEGCSADCVMTKLFEACLAVTDNARRTNSPIHPFSEDLLQPFQQAIEHALGAALGVQWAVLLRLGAAAEELDPHLSGWTVAGGEVAGRGVQVAGAFAGAARPSYMTFATGE